MKCNICDRDLSDTEITYNPELGKKLGEGAFEPCSSCLNASFEAAYCNGFVRDDGEGDKEDSSQEERLILEGAFDVDDFQRQFFGSEDDGEE